MSPMGHNRSSMRRRRTEDGYLQYNEHRVKRPGYSVGNEHVLLQPVDLLQADIFADLLVELGPGFPGPILHQLGGHTRADAGDEQEILALAGVQIDLHKCLAIELARLLRGELLVEQELV